MSLRTRIRGFTAWINLRLKTTDLMLNNVLMDLLTGTNMKNLLLSMTGHERERLQSFDGLTDEQKRTRVEWLVKDLKKYDVIPSDVYVDCRMFAMRSADHIFQLLWRLVCHDIWFIYERSTYLQHVDDDILTRYPFKWIPEPPPVKKKKKAVKSSLLAGFGAASIKMESDSDDDTPKPDSEYVPYPDAVFAASFKKASKRRPSPSDTILNMINAHLKMTVEGRKLRCDTLDDLVDSRVLCALVNSFVKDLFTSEVLLNDRWTINLVLRTAERVFHSDNPVDSEDLVEGDYMAIGAYFCYFFMVGYKFRQNEAVVRQHDRLKRSVRECDHNLGRLDAASDDVLIIKRINDLRNEKEKALGDMQELENRFNLKFCREWKDHAEQVKEEVWNLWKNEFLRTKLISDSEVETHKYIRQRIQARFDTFKIPRSITINDLCLSLVINLNLTGGSGFYKCTTKEFVSEQRRIVVRCKSSGVYHEDFSGRAVENTRSLLGLPEEDVIEINPLIYQDFDIFVECPSRNRLLKSGTEFLYQIFPGTTQTWQKLLIKAAKENEYDTVKNLALFFKNESSFLNCREPSTGSTALHWAARLGHYEIARFLLEQGADINAKNNVHYTPIFSAVEGLCRSVSHLLLEWGCDVQCKSTRGLDPFETTRNDEFRIYLIGLYDYYSSRAPPIMSGDGETMRLMIRDHKSGLHPMASLRSRCISGSTLLHTASYFGHQESLNELLVLGVDVDLADYKGASPIHRAKDVDVLKLLLDADAHINARDVEGNSPLHVRCYGEQGRHADLAQIILLLDSGAGLVDKNNRGLLPIHCAAMQGRLDVIELLLDFDQTNKIIPCLDLECKKGPPSPAHLALAGDYFEVVRWLLDREIGFKPGEPDLILKRVLFEQLKLCDPVEACRILLDHGASARTVYVHGDTTVHQAARTDDGGLLLELMLQYGADMDASNEEMDTALHVSVRESNFRAASILISRGADVRAMNAAGMTPFDMISDYEDWINSGYFTPNVLARLRAYSLRHSRELVRAISKRVKQPPHRQIQHFLSIALTPTAYTIPRTAKTAPTSSRRYGGGSRALTAASYRPAPSQRASTAPPGRALRGGAPSGRPRGATSAGRNRQSQRYALPPVTSASLSQISVKRLPIVEAW